jgi:hypothetical protein
MTSPDIHYRTVPNSSESQERQKGDVMFLVKFTVIDPHETASVLTTESVTEL